MSALKSIRSPEPMQENVPGIPAVVVKLTAAEIAQLARRKRARALFQRLITWVVMPTLFVAVYLYGVARNQYESVATVMVRSGNATHLIMLEQVLLSRDTLAKLEKRNNFSHHYAKQGDPWFGLPRKSGGETRYRLFRRFVSVTHDPATNVITISAKAFSAQHANAVARSLLEEGQAFLAALDPAQAEAGPLVVLAQPSLPNEASYPRRAHGVITAFFVSLALFVIVALLIAAVREHAQF